MAPCESDGECQVSGDTVLGPTTLGLIYVNPEGPLANGDTVGSAIDIKASFGQMGMNFTETVALIGGGHAFGKAHGACMAEDAPCGEGPMAGKGPNTLTSGLDGQWTTTPTTWSNEFFNNLFNIDWTMVTTRAGAEQWAPVGPDGPLMPEDGNVIMLTSDLALRDDDDFAPIAQMYAANITALELSFAEAWYKLTSQDKGPHERCVGEEVPEPRGWQNPLPAAPAADTLPPVADLREAVVNQLVVNGTSNAGLFATYAYNCGATFRATDFRGGCNGLRQRFPPYSDRPEFAGLQDALDALAPVKETYPAVSWSDLLVMAGQVAHEEAGGNVLPFCLGRVDAEDSGEVFVPVRTYSDPIVANRDNMKVMGLTAPEFVALAGRLRDLTYETANGPGGIADPTPAVFDNQFFSTLLNNQWQMANNGTAFQAEGEGNEGVLISPEDYALIQDPELLAIVQDFVANGAAFKDTFAYAWAKLMNADRYDGPSSNACASLYA